MADERRFAVKPCRHKGSGTGDYAIWFTPPSRKNPDGTTSIGFSFKCLIAGEFLSDQHQVLQQVADILNASHLGRPYPPVPEPMDMTRPGDVLHDC